ncbi:alpha-amylase/trypsin inhibitor-like [Oryza brachyantha]|uniref:alpha-amylase/trypsin inhibitor-like n=1 Tax=Oryza brachyantha TaxID=4533 RepID=UPI001ADCFEA4|nr:alpha-amylase/trypsin inhibitor-like [Oryza brachyantha]
MAPNRRLLLVAAGVLLSALAVAAADREGGECRAGEAFPHNPLSGCRGYVISRACPGHGPRRPMMAKARCCRELAAVPPRCRCEALRLFMDAVRAGEDHHQAEGGGGLRACPAEAQRAVAATLMAAEECDLRDGDSGAGEPAGQCDWLVDVLKH